MLELYSSKVFFIVGALLGFSAVAAGAFGAHAIKAKLAPEMLQVFEIGVRYQMYHALALIAVAAFASVFANNYMTWAGIFFISGTVVFSGSLYLYVLTAVRQWGMVTPVGGVLLLAGWASMAVAALK